MRKRYVVVDADGRSSIRPSTDIRRFESMYTPGFATETVWRTEPHARRPDADADPAETLTSFHPAPGGTVLMTMTVAPDEVFTAPDFDLAAASAEAFANSPGIAERMEPDNPGFHRTDTIDYVIVLDGEIVLRADENEAVLTAGDIAVQNGTHHAWANRSGRNATIAVMLIGIAP